MNYLPESPEGRRALLKESGVASFEELFRDIPAQLRDKGLMPIPAGLSEQEVRGLAEELSVRNTKYSVSLLGGGCYHHYIPAAVPALTNRAEFLTAYTPYQPEISQGLLQAIFEFQTMVSRLTGMDVSNASLYDGASALAEAAVMALSIKKRETIVIADSVHPEYRAVLATYAEARGFQVRTVKSKNGTVSAEEWDKQIDDTAAAVIVQCPNFFGLLEDPEEICEAAHNRGALFISCFTEPAAFGLIKPPGDFGADITVGEGQSLGIPAGFGGPHLGLIACRNEYARKLPGRIVGLTNDHNGKEGFVLTLQAREQHIRREKAASNICSNQALCALTATVYMAALGDSGFKKLARLNYSRAHKLYRELTSLPGFEVVSNAPFFNEFVLKVPAAKEINRKLAGHGIAGGLELERFYPEMKNTLLFCVTEMISGKDIARITEILK